MKIEKFIDFLSSFKDREIDDTLALQLVSTLSSCKCESKIEKSDKAIATLDSYGNVCKGYLIPNDILSCFTNEFEARVAVSKYIKAYKDAPYDLKKTNWKKVSLCIKSCPELNSALIKKFGTKGADSVLISLLKANNL